MFRLTVESIDILDLRRLLLEAADKLGGQVIQNVQAPAVDYPFAPEVETPQVADDSWSAEQDGPVVIGELDSRGLPWDERIHASSKATTKDGSWRYKRGADQALIARVEAAHRSADAANKSLSVETQPPTVGEQPVTVIVPAVPAPTVEVPVFISQPIATPATPIAAVPAAPTVVQVPVTSVPLSAAPLPTYEAIPVPQTATKPAHTLETFKANLIPTLAGLVKDGKLNQEYLEQLKAYFKVKEIWQIMNSESQLAELFENFCAAGLITKVG